MSSALPRFIDTNIILRFALNDDEVKAEESRRLLVRLEALEEKAVTSPLVLFETVFTLNRTYKQSKQRVAGILTALLNLRGLHVVGGKQVWFESIRYWLQYNMDFADSYNVAVMQAQKLTDIYSWDGGYDQVPGIRRVEPHAEEQTEAA